MHTYIHYIYRVCVCVCGYTLYMYILLPSLVCPSFTATWCLISWRHNNRDSCFSSSKTLFSLDEKAGMISSSFIFLPFFLSSIGNNFYYVCSDYVCSDYVCSAYVCSAIVLCQIEKHFFENALNFWSVHNICLGTNV